MNKEEINKAIEEEAERLYKQGSLNYFEGNMFIKGGKFALSLQEKEKDSGLTIEPNAKVSRQNENERLNNSEAYVYKLLDQMMDVDMKLYEQILDTTGFANYFNQLTRMAMGRKPIPDNPQPGAELKVEEKILESDSKKESNQQPERS